LKAKTGLGTKREIYGGLVQLNSSPTTVVWCSIPPQVCGVVKVLHKPVCIPCTGVLNWTTSTGTGVSIMICTALFFDCVTHVNTYYFLISQLKRSIKPDGAVIENMIEYLMAWCTVHTILRIF
jgi:hypothetical protein